MGRSGSFAWNMRQRAGASGVVAARRSSSRSPIEDPVLLLVTPENNAAGEVRVWFACVTALKRSRRSGG